MAIGRSRLCAGVILVLCFPSYAAAQSKPPPTGAPPAEGKAIVEAPKGPADAPKIEDKFDGTTITFASGGMWATGNARQLAGTANGAFETRWDNNRIGASILGNYGQGAPPDAPIRVTTQNVQARVRYDRYVIENASVFLINTGRHDRFQGLDFRYNLDPGVKYLFLSAQANTLWGEAGYDLQHDIRRNQDRVVLDENKAPVLDANGQPQLLEKTYTDHSTRLYVGYKRAFNKEVTLATGLEYLQSVVDSTRYRVNYDALFAAKVGGGLALGLGFTARYDHAPLPGKQKLDTASTLSLIYTFSDVPEPTKEAPPCDCPAPAPAPAPPQPAPPAPAPLPAPPSSAHSEPPPTNPPPDSP